jgi:DhnA family fructose-bisphosphate aldolase class Ia
MDSHIGKEIRLGRVFRPSDNRSVTVAFSHGVLLGPGKGYKTYDQMNEMMKTFQKADAVMLSPGMLKQLNNHYVGRDHPGLIIEADWQNVSRARRGMLPGNGRSTAMLTAEQALAAGADAIMTYLWMGGEDAEVEAQEVARNAEFARACEAVGLPLMIESRGLGSETDADGNFDLDLLAFHTRVAAELGADFIKTKYSGSIETFREITSQCPVPILVAGGSRLSTMDETLQLVENVIRGGGAGVVFGRNIFQFDNPALVLDGIIDRVHGIDDKTI